MTIARSALERRIGVALETSPPSVPLVTGGCGTGRTGLLRGLERTLRSTCQYLDVERSATTPERFLAAIRAATPAFARAGGPAATPREAFDRTLEMFSSGSGASGESLTFLLDEVLEIRTFENFPGLRHALPELLRAIAGSRNHFVLTTRYAARAARLVAGEPGPALLIAMPHLTSDEICDALDAGVSGLCITRHPRHTVHADLAPVIQALSDGRPFYIRAICDTVLAMEDEGAGDPISALAALLGPGGRIAARCAHSYELRLHRARGYGALKAILDILAEEEGLTLTEIAIRLGRTPGSTKDYLSWLEDVDLVAVERKRYRFLDPLLRLWVRLYCRPVPPPDADIAREVQCYAVARLAQPAAVAAAAAAYPSGARTA